MRGHEVLRSVEVDGVRQVVCGDNFTVLLTDTGGVWTCGKGSEGQLGLGVGARTASFGKREHNSVFELLEIGGAGSELVTESYRKSGIRQCGENAPPAASVVFHEISVTKA